MCTSRYSVLRTLSIILSINPRRFEHCITTCRVQEPRPVLGDYHGAFEQARESIEPAQALIRPRIPQNQYQNQRFQP